MTKHSWKFELGGKKYEVIFQVKYKGAFVTINGKEEKLEKGAFERAFNPEYNFTIAGKPARIYSQRGTFKAKFDLVVDGKSVSTGESVRDSLPIPRWAWALVAACIAIPVISLGGALPTGIAFGASAAIISYSKKPDVTTTKRLAVCAGILGVAWTLFLLTILLVLSLF